MPPVPGTRIGVKRMDRSEVITLIPDAHVQDENGVWRNIIENATGGVYYMTNEDGTVVKDEDGFPISLANAHTVFCQVDSVTASEFFEGGRNGLNPEYRFTLFEADYGGELVVLYKGYAYAVYRTYKARTDIIELYAERKGGTNGRR